MYSIVLPDTPPHLMQPDSSPVSSLCAAKEAPSWLAIWEHSVWVASLQPPPKLEQRAPELMVLDSNDPLPPPPPPPPPPSDGDAAAGGDAAGGGEGDGEGSGTGAEPQKAQPEQKLYEHHAA